MERLRAGSRGRALPSARLVSSMIAEDRDVRHHVQSLWLMVWGQFTDHDLSHTALSKDVLHPSGTPASLTYLLRHSSYTYTLIVL